MRCRRDKHVLFRYGRKGEWRSPRDCLAHKVPLGGLTHTAGRGSDQAGKPWGAWGGTPGAGALSHPLISHTLRRGPFLVSSEKPAVRRHSKTAPKQGDRPARGEAGPRLGVSGHKRKYSLSPACPSLLCGASARAGQAEAPPPHSPRAVECSSWVASAQGAHLRPGSVSWEDASFPEPLLRLEFRVPVGSDTPQVLGPAPQLPLPQAVVLRGPGGGS